MIEAKVWMVVGPAGGVAPAYGYHFTRKGLLADLGGKIPQSCRLVHFRVIEEHFAWQRLNICKSSA